MTNLSLAEPDNMLRPRISVFGVGGAGGNAINNMIRSGLEGCDFIAANTDSQALALSLAPRRVQLGMNLSRGLGAGSKPDVGRAAAEEQLADILALLEGSDMLFVTAGMGGGTGTGAAPVIARAARESGILTVGVVTKPFHFEGGHRMRQAEGGIAELQKYVDTLIVIPNQNLFRIANERTTFAEAFRLADEVLHCGVRGITDLMVMPGFMNLDFADVKTVMGEMGKAMMGTGEAEGEGRAVRAAEAAISNPLLDDISMKGARGVLINVTGGLDMTLFEMDQAANRIREEVDPEAQIKVGSTIGEEMDGRIRVSVIATGIDAALAEQQKQRAAAASGSASSSGSAGVATPAVAVPPAAVSGVAAAPSAPSSSAASAMSALRSTQEAARRTAPPPQAATVAPAAPVAAPQSAVASAVSSSVGSAHQAPPKPATGAVTMGAGFAAGSGYFTMPAAAVTSAPAASESEAPAAVAPSPLPSQPSPPAEPVAAAPPPAFSTPQSAPAARTGGPTLSPLSPLRTSTGVQASALPAAQRAPVSPGAVSVGTSSASPQARAEASMDMRVTQLTTAGNAGSPASVTPRSQSLFQRITGFGLVRPSSARGVMEEMEMESAQASPPSTGPRLSVDPADRQPLSSEADPLEIPAFLRRQTNH